MFKGPMRLHYRTLDGSEGSGNAFPGFDQRHARPATPHSPRFSLDAFALILERGPPAGARSTSHAQPSTWSVACIWEWFCGPTGREVPDLRRWDGQHCLRLHILGAMIAWDLEGLTYGATRRAGCEPRGRGPTAARGRAALVPEFVLEQHLFFWFTQVLDRRDRQLAAALKADGPAARAGSGAFLATPAQPSLALDERNSPN